MRVEGRVLFSSADPALVSCFYRLAERFGLNVHRNGGEREHDYAISSTELYRLLLHLGMTDALAREKRVPRAIMQAPKTLVIAFLRGLFDTDGTVDGGYPSLCSASEGLIREVQLLLLNAGMISSKCKKTINYHGEPRSYYNLCITGSSSDDFFVKIGFGLQRKQSLQRKVASNNPNVDVVPFVGQLVRQALSTISVSKKTHKTLEDYKRGRRNPGYVKLVEILLLMQGAAAQRAYQQIQLLSRLHLFWAEVEEIEDGQAQVYDLTVPGSHSFCANGLVNHNTFLAMAAAVAALTRKEVKRIVLCRPAVEAGEKLGFLPGDLAEKVNPYLRPLYDALNDMLDAERAKGLIDDGVIEIAPLAFMRGRTINQSFIILDEAQNTTPEQMKMFLTRLGYDSKAVVTGDITQIDLPTSQRSGLLEVQDILRNVNGLQFCYFSAVDVVRHPVVQEIVRAYERSDALKPPKPNRIDRRFERPPEPTEPEKAP